MSRGATDLVRAEAAEWMGDALLSIGTLAGFGIALALQLTGNDALARYVDPAMLVLTSAIYLKIPARLASEGLREVLTMSAAPAVREQVTAVVDDVAREWALAEPVVRLSKVGSRLDVEVVFLVEAASTARTVEEFDRVRAELDERLRATGLEPWMSVEFTADPRWRCDPRPATPRSGGPGPARRRTAPRPAPGRARSRRTRRPPGSPPPRTPATSRRWTVCRASGPSGTSGSTDTQSTSRPSPSSSSSNRASSAGGRNTWT